MSLTDDFLKGLQSRNVSIKQSGVTRGSTSKSSNKGTGSTNWNNVSGGDDLTAALVASIRKREKKKWLEEDIAPVRESVQSRMTTRHDDGEEEEEKKWYEKGLFEDGWDFGDVTKTILGIDEDSASLKDLTWGSLNRGYYNARYGEESYKALTGAENDKDTYKKILEGEEYQFTPGNKFAIGVSGAFEQVGQQLRQFTNPRTLAFTGSAAGAAAIAGQAGPQVLLPEEVITVPAAGIAAFTAGSAASNYEIEAGHAYNEMIEAGISEETAKKIAVGVGGVNAALELAQVDELVDAFKVVSKSGATKGVAKRILNELLERGVDVAKETGQEVLQEGVTIAGVQAASKMDNGEHVYTADEVKDRLKDTAVSSALSFGMMNVPATAKNTASIVMDQKKANSFTANEQTVIDYEAKNRIAEQEKKSGKKLTTSEKKTIEDAVKRDLEKGYLSIDTIEEALGGETYNQYKQVSEWEDSLQKQLEDAKKEYKDLHSMKRGDMTGEQLDREAELQESIKKLETQVKNVLATSGRDQLKQQLSEQVFGLAQGDRLIESYNERSRRGQAFEADLTQYDTKQQAVIQKAVESGVLNNTNRTHELVDMIAKISADKGVLFDFTNNANLKESGFAIEDKQVNGYVTKDGVTLNVDSPKYLESTVGHEITHVLEGTEFYTELQNTLFEYAKSKGEYDSRLANLTKLYEGVKDADINAELTADLVGDYLFRDADFINNLSVSNRNVFQKIYDEIKYLCKVVTAGSKEARELEKVKKAFEDAYREAGKEQTETKYSLSDSNGKQLTKEQQDYFKDSKMRDENGNLKVMYHGSQDAGFHTFDSKMSDDGTSFFFVDRNDVAASYSGTTETYEAKTIRSAEDMNNFLAEIGYDHYKAVERNGKFELLENNEHITTKDTAQEIYEEFCWYEGVGEGDANYKVYLNLKNPLVVDAEGRNWDNVSSEYWPELHEQWRNEFTQEEKDALIDLAGWEDFSTFKSEIERAVRDAGKRTADEYTKALDSAYWKNSDISSLFSMAANNFSDEVLKAEAVKQLTTRDYAQKAKSEGYDGVIFKNIVDIGAYGGDYRNPATVAIAFDSNQIKSTANVKPTSDADIRYSISEERNERGLDRKSEVQFSLSNDTAYMDKAISMNESMMRVDSNVMAETKAIRGRIAARMNDIKDRGLVGLPEDIEGNTYIANSSYDGTEENTTICPRSLASEAFVDAVSEYLGRPLSVEEQIYISQDLQGRSLTPECTYCYVATDRKAYRAFLGEYVTQRDAVLQKVKDNPFADVSRSGELYKEFLNGRKDTNPMYSRFKMWVDAYKNGKPMIDASHLANINKLMGDINSEFGAELKPQIVDAMKYAQSASWAKKRVNYVAYNGHILKWKQDRINKLNSHYGLRMYSFSDFHPAFVLENMQMITDASVRGLKMLGYTKDTDFVDIFAPSGMNINISTFGFEAGGNVYENNLIGAEWEKAKTLREQYPNVGITFVATNDTLVDWALNQDWIDVVVPFHLVRTGREVAKAFNYHDYTSESSDTKTKDWKKGDKKYIAPTDHNNDKATYLAALEKNHLKPRFERFISNPNYMKLVNECRRPASESKPVQPVFNEDAAMVALAKLEANGYYQPVGGSVDRMYEIAGEVAEAMTNELAPAMSLSFADEEAPLKSAYGATLGKDVRLEAAEDSTDVAPAEEIAPVKPLAKAKPDTVDAPVFETTDKEAVKGQTTMFEPEKPKETAPTTRKELHQNIVDRVKDAFKARGFDFDNVLKNAKNLSTFATVDNTPQRVMEKALGYKQGGILADITVNQVAQNESDGIKWLNNHVAQLKQISKQYHIKPGSKESAAAQMYAEGFFVNENNEIVRYGDPELIQDFPDANVRRNIKGLARDARIRQIYDETLAAINESRTRNLYPEIPKLDNYFLHFRAMEDTFSRLGLPFNPNDIRAKDLPTDLNGVTADLKPGQPYFASAMHREGKRTSFDLLGGLEKYLNSAKNQIYHIDDIQTLRALRNYIADTYGQAKGLENLDDLSQEAAFEQIQKVYNGHLSTFAKFLNEEANVLAGKTALIDRGLEGVIGRRGMTFLNTLNGQVGSNMVGYNISSSLTNFLPVVQTFAKTNKADFTKAFAQTVANKLSGGKFDSFAEDSPVVIRRKGSDRFYRTTWQKIADPGYALMGAVDDISTELIARTKYNEFTRKGMDSQQAHFETDKWVSKLMGDRSLGQQPQLYNSKLLGLVTKFQLEVRNQLDAQFYDTIQETKASNEYIQNGLLRNAKTAAKVASVFTQLAVVQHLYGMGFEKLAGYNPAFDIIEVLMTAFGWDDEEESEDTALDNIEQGFMALLEDMPYASTFLDGGRIPISSALPIEELVKGEDQYGNEKSRWETIGEVAPYYLMPGGYGQLKKTVQGLGMFSDEHPIAGSYTDSGNLRFPVEDTFGNRVKAGIFGQYASENARKYFDQEQRTLNPEQTEIFAELDIPIEEYWEYRDNLNEFYDTKDKLLDAAYADGATDEDVLKGRYIDAINDEIYALYDQQKEIAGKNITGKKYLLRELQRQMEEKLSESKYAVNNIYIDGMYAEIGGKRFDRNEDGAWFEISAENDAYGFYEREQRAVNGFGISYSEYWNNREKYDDAYTLGKDAITTVNTVFGARAFANYASELSQLKADKDKNGNSISGSKKKKVLDYIQSLEISYGEKIVLFKSQYPKDDDYNYDIISYVDGRNDISYEDKVTVLEELGFEVDSEGNVYWD